MNPRPIPALQSGDDSRENWRTINAVATGQKALEERVLAMLREIQRRQVFSSAMQPALLVKSTGEDDDLARNYFVCHTWDGTTEGTADIKVAKNELCQQPASKVFLGVTYTYTAYTDGADDLNDTRTSDNGDTTETQMVTPPYEVDQVIYVKQVSWSGVVVDGQDLKLMEDSGRCWAKVS